MKFFAKKPIQRGDELVFDYGYVIENAIKPISNYFNKITR
jgi:SET domain-containing protein